MRMMMSRQLCCRLIIAIGAVGALWMAETLAEFRRRITARPPLS